MHGFSIDINKLSAVIKGKLPKTTPLGHARDSHGNFYTVFPRTDRETNEFVLSEDGRRLMFNLKKALPRG
jgi:hypothetical protein